LTEALAKLQGASGGRCDHLYSQTLQAQGMAASAIDFADVSPITQSGCAALDAYRKIRPTGRHCLSVPQRPFEVRTRVHRIIGHRGLCRSSVVTQTYPKIAHGHPSATPSRGAQPAAQIRSLIF